MKNLYQTAIGIGGMNKVVANSVCCSIADIAAAIPTAIRYKRNWQTTAGHGFLLFMRTGLEQRYSGLATGDSDAHKSNAPVPLCTLYDSGYLFF